MKYCFFIVCIGVFLFGCKKEEVAPSAVSSGLSYGFITGDQGSLFTVVQPDGSLETVVGENILGWDSGNLLNGSFFHMLRIQVGSTYCYLRYSFPSGSNWQQEVQMNQTLNGVPFELQDSSNMTSTVVEWYAPNSDEWTGNATGSVVLQLSNELDGTVYDLYGAVDGIFNSMGGQYHVYGQFWKKDI
jgi:hypothetical protein